MNKYWQILKVSFINRLDYHQELFMSLFIGVIIFIGQAVFWLAVFDKKEVVNGFTFFQILQYYLFARIVSEIIDSKVGFKISDLVISGQVSNLLLRPINVPTWLFFQEVGQILIDLLVKTGVYILGFVFLLGPLHVQLKNIPLFLVSIIFSLAISFSLFLLAGCFAFWTDNATAMNYALRRIILFLAGGLVPIAFFPSLFQKILQFLPFYYMFNLPVKLLSNSVGQSEIFTGITVQIFWIITLWFIAKRIFSFAIKKNESVGL